MIRYYYSKDGTDIQGPISEDDLWGMLSAGLLGDNTQICEEGTDTWRPIYFMSELSATSSPLRTDREGDKYECPQCGSSNIQSVQFLYEAGTSTSVADGRFVGVAGFGSDHLTPVGGVTKITQHQQTRLAARYSPPDREIAAEGAGLFLILGLLLNILGGISIFITLIGWALLLAGTASMVYALIELIGRGAKQKEFNKVYARQLAQWQQSFVCLKCGELTQMK